MGRKTRAQQNHINNLSKSKNHQQPSVEDIPEDENSNSSDEDLLEQGFFFLDDAPELEEDDADESEDEDEEDEDEEHFGPKNDADIDRFNAVLFEAQAAAVKAEREAVGEKPKRKQFYSGNSDRTKHFYNQKHRKLAATNQTFINNWFTKEREVAPVTEVDSESESEGEDEVEITMHRIFPIQERQVSDWEFIK